MDDYFPGGEIIYPNGTGPEDYPGINFYKPQPDINKPGGTDPGAPPVPNNPKYALEVFYDGDDFFFYEFYFDGVPLGMWYFEDNGEDEGYWMFDDYIPKANPETAAIKTPPLYYVCVGTLIIGMGAAITLAITNKKRQRR